jgi:hypothetical protein
MESTLPKSNWCHFPSLGQDSTYHRSYALGLIRRMESPVSRNPTPRRRLPGSSDRLKRRNPSVTRETETDGGREETDTSISRTERAIMYKMPKWPGYWRAGELQCHRSHMLPHRPVLMWEAHSCLSQPLQTKESSLSLLLRARDN